MQVAKGEDAAARTAANTMELIEASKARQEQALELERLGGAVQV
jgi:hypothetical protein